MTTNVEFVNLQLVEDRKYLLSVKTNSIRSFNSFMEGFIRRVMSFLNH